MNISAEGALPLMVALSTGMLPGHNLWIVATNKSHSPGEMLRLSLNTGELFPESDSAHWSATDRILLVETDYLEVECILPPSRDAIG